MCIFARLGGAWGLKLTRAAFSVLLKFSDNVDPFMKLLEIVDKTATEIGQAE